MWISVQVLWKVVHHPLDKKKRKLDSTDVIEKRMEDAYNIMKSVCDKPKKIDANFTGNFLVKN